MIITFKGNANSGHTTKYGKRRGKFVYEMLDIIGPDGTVWATVHVDSLHEFGGDAWAWNQAVYEQVSEGRPVELELSVPKES